MSKTKSKALSVVLSVTTTIWLSGAVMLLPVANGQTNASIQDQINALMATIAQLQGQLGGSTASTVSTANCGFSRSLTLSATGSDVKCLQQYLNASGNTVSATGAGSPGNETSYFGGKTKAAVVKWQAANGVSPTSGLFGPISRAKYNALMAVVVVPTPTPVPGSTPTPVPGTVLSLAVASDNPVGSTVPKGASAVNVLKFTVTGNGTLNDLTFKRNGVGATADFSSAGLYLYEGVNRLTSGRSLNTTSNEVSFINLGLAVSGTRTLWLAADIATGAATGDSDYFTLSASNGTPSVSGSLMGNTFTIGGASSGVATTTKVGSLSSTTVGAKNVEISEFRLDVSSAEDVEVSSIALTQGGSISNSNLSNFVLKQNDVTVATGAAISTKDLVTLAFASPFKIEKGQQKTFKLYADIAATAKSGDQIKMYFDSASDVKAKGLTYGFNVIIDISGMNTSALAHTVELKGGDVTITFNGPIAKDVAVRGQDVEVFNFTIATKNTIEIRNWRFVATTSMTQITNEGFNDFKVWDTTSNSVITSPVDITATSTNITPNDVYTLAAGASRTFKVTVDVDPDDDTNDTLVVSLLGFTASDIKNLDNNQFVAISAIVPNTTLNGNTMTVKAPSLDIQLSSNPSSQTLVQGSKGKKLVAFGFKATGDTIKISSVKITASFTTGTLTTDELSQLALYDGDTGGLDGKGRISDIGALASDLTNTFNNLNIQVGVGETKIITVKGDISNNAGNTDVWHILIGALTDVTATDANGNSASVTGATANSGNTVAVTIANVGDVAVVTAADDDESKADIMLAGGERILGKFRFTASNEDMTVNKMHILLASTTGVTSATADDGTVVDDIPVIKLYDGATQIGTTGGYSLNSSGASTSIAEIGNLGWVIPKNGAKTLTVKGVVSEIGQSNAGADFGTSVWAVVMGVGFDAQGATANDTSITAAAGNEKVIYKSVPKFTSVSKPATDSKLAAGTIPVLRFKIKADGPDQISWKQIQFKVAMSGATMTAVDATPLAVINNVGLKDVTSGGSTQLSIATAFSGTATTTGGTPATIGATAAQTGYVTLMLTSEQTIASMTEKEYELHLNFSNLTSTSNGGATAQVSIYRTETAKFTGSVVGVRQSLGVGTTAAPSLIWSDYSVLSHSATEGRGSAGGTSTLDWANAYLLNGIPSNTVTLSN